MKCFVLVASMNGFKSAERVVVELNDARLDLAASGIEMRVIFLGLRPGDVVHTQISGIAEPIGLPFISRGDAGLTFAELIQDGFRGALDSGADLVVTIDGDGRHDARQIPALVAFHLEQGCGLVVASRWARGGSSPGAGFAGAIASRVGNVVVKLLTGARGVTDSATSFRSCASEVAEFLSREKLPSGAHGFFAAMVPVVQAGGFLASDFPIRFMPRIASRPRISGGDVREFAASLPLTRRLVRRIRHDMRSNQVLWAQRNPRLRSQGNSNGSTFGAIAELELLSESSRFLSWIVEVLEPQIGHRVLEVGAGLGAISIRLAEAGHLVTALEPADNVFPQLAEKSRGVAGLEVMQCTSGELLESGAGIGFDSIVYVSVLEHILEDVAELRTACSLVRPGGTVSVFVPAMPGLYGSLDFKSGHYRRYDEALLRQVFRDAGLQPVSICWMDLLGVFPYFVLYRLLGVSRLDAGSSGLYDSVLVPISRFLESIIGSPPFGKNLVAVGIRPDESAKDQR
jgi:SAM-dependent methyltransferase